MRRRLGRHVGAGPVSRPTSLPALPEDTELRNPRMMLETCSDDGGDGAGAGWQASYKNERFLYRNTDLEDEYELLQQSSLNNLWLMPICPTASYDDSSYSISSTSSSSSSSSYSNRNGNNFEGDRRHSRSRSYSQGDRSDSAAAGHARSGGRGGAATDEERALPQRFQLEREEKGYQKFRLRQVSDLAAEDKLEEALEKFEKAMEDKVQPTDSVYSQLIRCAERNNNVRKALSLYNDCKKRGMLPSSHGLTSLFVALRRRRAPGDAEIATRLYESLKEGEHLNTIICNAAIQAFGVLSLPEQAERVFEDMCAKPRAATCPPDVVTMTNLLAATTALGDPKKAQRLLERAKALQIKLDVQAFTVFVRALGQKEGNQAQDAKDRADTAMTLLRQMKILRFNRTEQFFAALLGLLAKTKRVEHLDAVVADMAEQNVEASLECCGWLLRLHALQGRFDLCENLFDACRKKDMMDSFLCMNMLFAYNSQLTPVKGVALLQRLLTESPGLEISTPVFGMLFDSLLRALQTARSAKTLQQLPPLEAAVLQAVSLMKDYAVTPNDYIVRVLQRICATCNKLRPRVTTLLQEWPEAATAFAQTKPTGRSHGSGVPFRDLSQASAGSAAE
eukprot:m.121622 g.121622  ORF g.121622 m.121622 type:complete len:620 (+) comp16205_c0_seq1:233-2092(+)